MIQLRATLDYVSNLPEEPGSCIIYHRDKLEHPGGSIFLGNDSLEQCAGWLDEVAGLLIDLPA